MAETLAQLRERPHMRAVADACEATLAAIVADDDTDNSYEDALAALADAFATVDRAAVTPADAALVGQLVTALMAQTVAGLADVDEVIGDVVASVGTPVTPPVEEVVSLLKAAALVAQEFNGTVDDRGRVKMLASFGFVDTFALVDPADVADAAELAGLERAVAVMAAASQLVSAIMAALESLRGLPGDMPAPIAALGQLVDGPAANLFRYFPDEVAQFDAAVANEVEAFLEAL
jgi:hypothetical protein